MRKICVVTGTRADWGILKMLVNKIILSKKLELQLYVTGSHLLKKYGHTIDLIIEDGIEIKREIPIYKEEKVWKWDLGQGIGASIVDFSYSFSIDKPDLVLVLGDRFEIFSAVIAATALDIPIAHIHGGDHNCQGQVDEKIRHSITNFSHIHFPASLKSASRLGRMGEDYKRIFMVGSPSIDMMLNYHFLSKQEICKKIDLDCSKQIAIFIYHPYIPEHKEMGVRTKYMFDFLKKVKSLQVVVIYPNNDLGSEMIIQEIEKLKEENLENFKIIKNLDRIDYLSLLKHCDVMIGNSSSGIIDSPTFKIPVVNIGKRNYGRESAENVLDTTYNDLPKTYFCAISRFFKDQCSKVESPYGDGRASERIVEILENIEIDDELINKRFLL